MVIDKLANYKGEWCRSVYSEDEVELGKATRGIPLFDIELPIRGSFQYDEGVRKTEEEITDLRAREGYEPRPYNPAIVGTGSAQRPSKSRQIWKNDN